MAFRLLYGSLHPILPLATCEENTISMRFAVLASFVLLFISCTKDSSEAEIFVASENSPVMEQQLLDLINDHRAKLGQPVLQHSKVAYEYANDHNDYMIQKGALSHDNFAQRAASISAETSAEKVAENVAKDYSNAADAFQGWLSSSQHKSTIEDNFTHTAVSVKKDAGGNYYYTQLFYR